jgi:capsular polysaccharide biosynthesis protein
MLNVVLAFIGGLMVGGTVAVVLVCLLIKGRRREESLEGLGSAPEP